MNQNKNRRDKNFIPSDASPRGVVERDAYVKMAKPIQESVVMVLLELKVSERYR